MGQTVSLPDPNATLQVIGAGMSRTGTTSFGKALEILLKGPVYHGGTQLLLSDETHIKTWIDVCKHTPIKCSADREFVLDKTKKLVSGYVATCDMPQIVFVEELMASYPNAKVICTVRDPDKWWASMEPMVQRGNNRMLQWILAPLPVLRYLPQFHDTMDAGRFGEILFRDGETKPTRQTYDRHIEYLKRVVPEEKLFFYDVRDGWEPLCKILECDVPKDLEFPRLNDAEAMQSFFKTRARV